MGAFKIEAEQFRHGSEAFELNLESAKTVWQAGSFRIGGFQPCFHDAAHGSEFFPRLWGVLLDAAHSACQIARDAGGRDAKSCGYLNLFEALKRELPSLLLNLDAMHTLAACAAGELAGLMKHGGILRSIAKAASPFVAQELRFVSTRCGILPNQIIHHGDALFLVESMRGQGAIAKNEQRRLLIKIVPAIR